MPLGGLRKFRPGFFFIFGLGTSGIYIYIFFTSDTHEGIKPCGIKVK